MGLPHISQGTSSVLPFMLCPPGSGCDRATTRASGKRTHSRRQHIILSIVRFCFSINYGKTVEKARFLLPPWANRRYPPTKRHRLRGVSGRICMRDIRHRDKTTNKTVRTRRAFSLLSEGSAGESVLLRKPPNPLRHARGVPQGVRPEMLRQQKGHRLRGVSGEICMRDIRHRDKTTNKAVRTRRAFSFRRIMRAKASASPPPNPLRHARGAPQEVRPEMLRQVKGTGAFACL